ncbi:MAG: nitroreductase [Desulfobacterales bacterium]
MDVIDAIKERKSIRSFRPESVPKETLHHILEVACRAPSSVNQQPWEFAVIAGDVLEKVRQLNTDLLLSGTTPQRDYPTQDRPKDSVYRKRQVDLAATIFERMNIPREDKAKRMDWLLRGFAFFGAPAAIVIFSDKCLGDSGSLLDIGAVMQNICLAALEFGLGTCIENQGIQYSDMLREVIGIPDTKKIAVSIAVGYPDWEFPANSLLTPREPVDKLTLWRGFEPSE